MCEFKTREQRRDQAIGWLEEARDGFDSVLSELEDGTDHDIIFGEEEELACPASGEEGLASSDSRIRKAMNLIDQAKTRVATLRAQVNGGRNRKLRDVLDAAYSILGDIFYPDSALEINQIISDLHQAMEYLRSCEFPDKTVNGSQ